MASTTAYLRSIGGCLMSNWIVIVLLSYKQLAYQRQLTPRCKIQEQKVCARNEKTARRHNCLCGMTIIYCFFYPACVFERLIIPFLPLLMPLSSFLPLPRLNSCPHNKQRHRPNDDGNGSDGRKRSSCDDDYYHLLSTILTVGKSSFIFVIFFFWLKLFI